MHHLRWDRWIGAAALSGAVLLSVSSTLVAETVVIGASKDNTLFQDAQGDVSDGIGPSFFVGRTGQANVRRALVAFDVAAVLPVEAIVDSVELELFMSNAPNATSRTIAVHRVLKDWGEGASFSEKGLGAPAEQGDATWLHSHFPNEQWAAEGGDFEGTARTSALIGGEGFYSWKANLAQDVQQWLNNPSSNFGWLLKGEELANTTARRFDSRENSTLENRPKLIVHYHAVTPTTPSTWGRVKRSFDGE